MSVALGGYSLRQERLAGSRRAVEENPLRCFDAQLLEDLRMSEGQLDHLPYFLNLVFYATDIFVGYLWYSP